MREFRDCFRVRVRVRFRDRVRDRDRVRVRVHQKTGTNRIGPIRKDGPFSLLFWKSYRSWCLIGSLPFILLYVLRVGFDLGLGLGIGLLIGLPSYQPFNPSFFSVFMQLECAQSWVWGQKSGKGHMIQTENIRRVGRKNSLGSVRKMGSLTVHWHWSLCFRVSFNTP